MRRWNVSGAGDGWSAARKARCSHSDRLSQGANHIGSDGGPNRRGSGNPCDVAPAENLALMRPPKVSRSVLRGHGLAVSANDLHVIARRPTGTLVNGLPEHWLVVRPDGSLWLME